MLVVVGACLASLLLRRLRQQLIKHYGDKGSLISAIILESLAGLVGLATLNITMIPVFVFTSWIVFNELDDYKATKRLKSQGQVA